MVEYKVLITTSGLGTRLGNLTDNTNKCLVRVTDKPSISYIVESYPKSTRFVISLGYYGDYVRQYLSLAHPECNFTFVEVDKYKGDGSSLGYSILQCKDELQCPFIFHASDTIITNTTLPNLSSNWMVGSYKDDASHYRTLLIKDGKISKVNEKGEINYDSLYVGVSGIKDYTIFFEHLNDLVENKGGDLSDVHVIEEMLSNIQFDWVEISLDNWFDVGNVNELNRTRECFECNIEVLDKTDESIFFFDDFVIKFFANQTVNKNRVLRGEILKGLVPDMIASTDNFFKYKKTEGSLFSRSVNQTSFLKFLEWSKDNLWVKSNNVDISEKCHDFYIKKTKDRVEKYLNGSIDGESEINGELVPSIHELLSRIDEDWLCDGVASQFHGDFILDNVIETEDSFSLIDWRQDFGGDIHIGDIYYDLAKLNHNLTVNHDIVGKGLFDKDKSNCHILTNSKLNECKIKLRGFILKNNYSIGKVEVLTALIWINMAPLHEYPFNDFLFNFGKYNLNKTLNNYGKNN